MPSLVLFPIPAEDFDPTEVSVTWRCLVEAGHQVVFATPQGQVGSPDPIMVTGKGLGPLGIMLRADKNGRDAWENLSQDKDFNHPLAYPSLDVANFDALVLPGGHAPGMRTYLEATSLQRFVGQFFISGKVVGAICHGVVLAARSPHPESGRSVLEGKRVTSLPRWMELSAWSLTVAWMGNYYRTYPHTTVQDEVSEALGKHGEFLPGPWSLKRDGPTDLASGFIVEDQHHVFGRWPGDAHRFGMCLVHKLAGS